MLKYLLEAWTITNCQFAHCKLVCSLTYLLLILGDAQACANHT